MNQTDVATREVEERVPPQVAILIKVTQKCAVLRPIDKSAIWQKTEGGTVPPPEGYDPTK